MDCFEVAASFCYAGGKLIIVKHLWACYMYMEKVLYTVNAPLYIFHFTFPNWYSAWNSVVYD